MGRTYLLFLTFLLMFSCNSLKHQQRQPIRVHMGPCKGFCPEYKLTFLNNNTVVFDGIRNVAILGKVTKKISQSQSTKIFNAFTRINWSELELEYDAKIYDMPTTVIEQDTNSVSFKRLRTVPSDIKEFMQLVDKFLKEHQLL